MPPLPLHHVQAIGSRLISRACPPGTPSSIVCQRLRRFQRCHPRHSHDQFRAPESNKRYELPRSARQRPSKRPVPPINVGAPEHASAAGLPSSPHTPAAHERVFLALRQKNPDELLKAFLHISKDLNFIRSIPPTTFTAVFHLLDPKFFVQPLQDLHHEISGAHTRLLGTQPIQETFAKYVKCIGEITRIRRLAGLKLGITDYTFLLNCARAVGAGDVALGLWRDMKMDGITPDTTCYNHYLAALCWSGMFYPVSRHKVRVIPYHMVMRTTGPVREGFDNYTVGPEVGIKAKMLREFDNMVRSGLLGDEKTFALLMTGMAREGDLNGCKAILNKVWDIDLGALLGSYGTQVVKEYPKTSPLRPGPDLLMAIAHVWGCNNDIPTALRLVDHVSQGYSIPIPLEVWAHLQEWTFVLAVPRFGPRKLDSDGASTGKLPKRAVSSLWETMTNEPYNVRPSMPMYNREIKNLTSRDMLKQMLQLMEGARQLYLRSIQKYRRSQEAYRRARALWRSHRLVLRSTKPIDKLRREVEYNAIIKRRNLFFIKRWVRLLITYRGGFKWRAGRGYDPYTRRVLPSLIDTWRAFLPELVYYNTPDGHVMFNSRPKNVVRYRYYYSEKPAGEASGN